MGVDMYLLRIWCPPRVFLDFASLEDLQRHARHSGTRHDQQPRQRSHHGYHWHGGRRTTSSTAATAAAFDDQRQPESGSAPHRPREDDAEESNGGQVRLDLPHLLSCRLPGLRNHLHLDAVHLRHRQTSLKLMHGQWNNVWMCASVWSSKPHSTVAVWLRNVQPRDDSCWPEVREEARKCQSSQTSAVKWLISETYKWPDPNVLY